jgi:hypothetical protein
MGVKVRLWKGGWWIFINHRGRRRAKKAGDRDTALRVAKELRERLGRADLHLPTAEADAVTFKQYSETWLDQARLNLKPARSGSIRAILSSTSCRRLALVPSPPCVGWTAGSW